MANQFVYSSSPHNLDGNSGWGILTKTSGLQLDGDQLRQMRDFIVEPYSGNDAADVDKPRQSFSFFKANGCWLLECSTATGKRWYLGDNRGGEYVAHVYVFDVLPDGFTPLSYLDSDGFWKEIPPEWKKKAGEISMMDSSSGEKCYPPVPELPERLEVKDSHYKFTEILKRVPDAAVSKIGKILETVASRLNSPNTASCPVFDANSDASIDTMALVSQLFPCGDRTRLQFSTFLNKDYADRIPTFNELAFYGTVKDGDSDSNTGLFDDMTFGSCRYPLELKNKEDIEDFKKVVDDLETSGSFDDAARRFVVMRTNVKNLPDLLKGHLDDAEKLVTEMDACISDKMALYDAFKGVSNDLGIEQDWFGAIYTDIKIRPDWLKAVRALSDAKGLIIGNGFIDIREMAGIQEASEILNQFDTSSAEPFRVWLKIASLHQNPSGLDRVVEDLKNHDNYDDEIKPAILGVMENVTADMHLKEFVEFNTQPGIQREVLLQGLSERERKVEDELMFLKAEVDKAKVKLRFARLGLFAILLALFVILGGIVGYALI